METNATLTRDELSFSCPSCQAPYSWNPNVPSARESRFSVSCDSCGVTFQVRNPAALGQATIPADSSVLESAASNGNTSGPQPAYVVSPSTPDVGIRKMSLAGLSVTIVAFLLPFFSMTCQGQKVYTFSGRQLVTGTTIKSEGMFGQKQEQRVTPEVLAVLAFLAAAAGLVVAYTDKKPSRTAGIFAGAAVVLLLLLSSKLSNDAMKQTSGLVQVTTEFGYWLAVLSGAFAAVASFGLLKGLAGALKTATESQGSG